jgi:hypothetical protein
LQRLYLGDNVTKAELQKHGEKLANNFSIKINHNPTKSAQDFANDRQTYILAFNQALELLFPLVNALDKIGHDTKINCNADSAKNECFDVAQVALAELEKKVRGE